jgi:hypothetical protein
MSEANKDLAPTVAVVHAHFGINTKQAPALSGEFTRDEQVKAIERFVKWHERQAAIGRDLMRRLLKESATAPVEEVPA